MDPLIKWDLANDEDEPMSLDTTIVTSGRYTYERDGEAVAVDERFEVRRDGRGLVVRSWRTAPGTHLEVEALHGVAGDEDVQIWWRSDLLGAAPVAEARYTRSSTGAREWERRFGPDDPAVADVLDVPAETSFFPLLRVFSGRTMARLVAKQGQEVPVLVPDIRDPQIPMRWLTALLDQRRVENVKPDHVTVDGIDRPCVRVDYLGGSYDEPAAVWVDAGGLLLRYTWNQPGVGDWDVRVTDVAGEWPHPSEWR